MKIVTNEKIKRKVFGLEDLILSIPSVIGIILLVAYTSLNPSIYFLIVGLATSYLLPNVYSDSILSFSKHSLKIDINNNISWKDIKNIEIHRTRGLISNYIKIYVYCNNSSKKTFFLCKQNFFAWENQSLEEFKKNVPSSVNIKIIDWLR